MTTRQQEQRAHDLLRWVEYSLPSDFDDELAAAGHYTRLQRQRSDKALDAWEPDHDRETGDELAAFRELERLGVYSQQDFYSPTKAKDGFYTDRLNRLRSGGKLPGRVSESQRQDSRDYPRGSGFGGDAKGKGRGERPRLRRRNTR